MNPEIPSRPLQCRSCGAENAPDSAYCAYCGNLLPAEERPEADDGGAGTKDGVSPIGDRFAGPKIGFKRIGIFKFVIFSILTLGIYPACWIFLRRRQINALASTEKLSDFVAFLPLGLTLISLLFGMSLEGEDSPDWMSLISFALWIWIAFRMRRMLRDHVAGIAPDYAEGNVAPSKLWTFLFTCFYIQHHINRLIDVDILRRTN